MRGIKLKRLAIISLVAFSLLLAGCASSGNKHIQKETETSVQTKIQEGKTTKTEVKGMFGSPDTVNFTDGGKEIWKYSFAKVKVSGKSFIPFYGLFHNGTTGTKKELTILFDGDKVQKYTMSESAIDTKSGWAD